MDRVLMSAEACLAGLFPPHGDQIWKEGFNWQPIPVHTKRNSDDGVLASSKRCDRYQYFMLQFMNTTTYTDLFMKYAPLFSYLEQNTGQSISTLLQIQSIKDTLFIEQLKCKRFV